MSSKGVCKQCGCTDIDTDPARGDAVCTNCGSVLEDQIIVSEIQFEEHATGASSVIGQFVSTDGSKSHSLGISFPHGMKKESRTITLENGRKRIQLLGSQLKLNQHCMDTAFNFFKMAVHKRLTRGRKTSHVTAACLYIVCRTEGTPHFLLDFSDVLQINVYSLGRDFLFLSRALCINIPAIDPCLYIARFAHKLEFGDKTHEVSMTALRLVARMKRDWMHTGRRPSGLCGAALIVAARMHDFSRSVQDLVHIVKVTDSTIRKRLTEFSNTASSQLTIEEFQNIDLEEEADPPSFTENRLKAQKAKLAQQLEEQNKMPELENTVTELQKEIEKKLEQPRGGIWASYAKMSDESQASTSKVTSGSDEVSEVSKFIEEETLKPCLEECETSEQSESDRADAEYIKNIKPAHVALGMSGFVREAISEDSMKSETESSQKMEGEDDGDLDLTGIDDAELDKFLLSEEEIKTKTEMWMVANADYLQAQKEKEEKLAKEREEEAKNPDKKKQKKTRKRRPRVQAATAEEAIVKLLQEKKISNKINYDVLNDLKGRGITPVSTPVKEPPTPAFLGGDNKPALNRLRKSSVAVDLTETEDKPKVKKIKVEESEKPEVVVESGPVQYAPDVKEDLEEEEEISDEEEHVSAAQYFGRSNEDYEDHDVLEVYDED